VSTTSEGRQDGVGAADHSAKFRIRVEYIESEYPEVSVGFVNGFGMPSQRRNVVTLLQPLRNDEPASGSSGSEDNESHLGAISSWPMGGCVNSSII
jgi:hypothetical protein